MTVWYKVDHNRFTYRELWRLSGRRLGPFAQAVWRKWLKVPLPLTSGHAFPDTLDRLDLKSLPDRPRDRFRAFIAQAEGRGLRFLFCHKACVLGDIAGYSAVLMNADGTILVSATWIKAGRVENTNVTLGSRILHRRLMTSTERGGIEEPLEFDVWRLPGKSLDELLAIHAGRLDRLGREHLLPATEADVLARIVENRQLYHAFHLARGVHVPMTQAEVDRLSGPVMADLVADGGNPYRAPREDEDSASPRVGVSRASRTWVAPVVSGFVFGAFVMEILAIANYAPDLAKDEPGLYFCFLFLFWPFVFGAFCAGVGLAVWLIRRIFWRLIP